MAIILSSAFTLIYGRIIIRFLKAKQIGESVRDLGLAGQNEKAGTPTMGGVIIILGTLIPVFLLAQLDNVYIQLLIITILSMGTIGLVDDYIKVFKNDKDGLKGRFKVAGQLLLGFVVGSVLYFHPGVTVKEEIDQDLAKTTSINDIFTPEKKSTLTSIPLFKNNAFDYSSLLSWISPDLKKHLDYFHSNCCIHNCSCI